MFDTQSITLAEGVKLTSAPHDKVINLGRVLSGHGKSSSKANDGTFFEKIIGFPRAVARFCGWSPSVTEPFSIEDTNGDGVCSLTIVGSEEFIISGENGERQTKGVNNKGSVSLELTKGTYKLEIYHG